MEWFPARKSKSEIGHWDPFREMATIHDRFNQLFNRIGMSEPLMLEGAWTPSMDVFETNENLVVKVDVPGMERDDLNVEMDDGNLVVRGERRHEEEEKRENYVHYERAYGAFMRRFPIPDYVDSDKIKATCKNGVLNIELAKIPGKKTETKKITVN